VTLCVPETTPACERVELLYRLAVAGSNSYSVNRMVPQVSARARARGVLVRERVGDWYARILAEEALREVHKLPYRADPPNKDCYKNVDQTATQGGECKALNVLLVALLFRLGIKACPVSPGSKTACGEVVWIMQTGKPLNHVATMVWLDGQPFWADASIKDARLGESPYQALARTNAWHVVGGS
jgi:transglutaminase-like putative cysteine protease